MRTTARKSTSHAVYSIIYLKIFNTTCIHACAHSSAPRHRCTLSSGSVHIYADTTPCGRKPLNHECLLVVELYPTPASAVVKFGASPDPIHKHPPFGTCTRGYTHAPLPFAFAFAFVPTVVMYPVLSVLRCGRGSQRDQATRVCSQILADSHFQEIAIGNCLFMKLDAPDLDG